MCTAVCGAPTVTFVSDCDYQEASAGLKLQLLFFFLFLILFETVIANITSEPTVGARQPVSASEYHRWHQLFHLHGCDLM